MIGGFALVPSMVARDELRSGVRVDHGTVPDLIEHFYAITLPREWLARPESEVLGSVLAEGPLGP